MNVMRFLLTLFLIAIPSFASFSQSQSQARSTSQAQINPKSEVEVELNSTAASYRTGDFAEAQRHAERAVSLDPSNRTAAIFLARIMHRQYKPRDESQENIQLARAAIADYQRVLTLDSQNEEAYKAIAVLYAMIHEDQLLRAWVLQRAMNAQVSNQKRAEAYATLAGKDWDCSFKFTELPNHKITEEDGKKVAVTYKVTAAEVAEFLQTKQCVTNGFQMADAAILLDAESEAAWSYKTNLFFEAAKLAEMEGLDLAKADFERQAKETGVQAARLSEKRRRDEENGEQLEISPRELPPPPAPKKPRAR